MITLKGFLEASDAHTPPSSGMPRAWWHLCNRARELGVPVVADGDFLDLIIYGLSAYYASPAVQDFMRSVDGLECYYIVGNHEVSAGWVRNLFKSCPNIHVVNSLDVEVKGHKWHIEHGDRYSLDWSWMRPLYTWVALAAMRICPGLWLRFCRRWRPSALAADGERDKYTKLTGLIRYNALNDAVEHHASVTIGHTHLAGRTDIPGLQVLDGGDLRDGSAVYVNPKGEGSIKWFGGTHGTT